MVAITVQKSTADIEFLQANDWGLILRFSVYPDAASLDEEQELTLVSSDGDEFAGCYVYEKHKDFVGVGVS